VQLAGRAAGEPEEYGPFHRLQSAGDNELVSSTGMLGGHPARNIAAGLFPKVKAYEGPLPAGRKGIEFYTVVRPDRGCVPGCPVWSGPRLGVVASETDAELVLIAVRIVKRVDR
jgi:hypothetical protein